MSDVVNVFSEISNLDVSPQFNSYSKVVIHVDDETTVEYGNNSGRTLEFDNPFGTQAMAQTVLASLQRSGYQYQPYAAQGTILDPAAEIGDALAATNVYGGIYTRSRNFGRLMKADVSAPHEEEINHEYQFESPEERQFKRETRELRASLILTNEAIQAQVSRLDVIDQEISIIKQTSGEISAEVMKRSGGSSSTFGWLLTDTKWALKANGSDVFVADKNGVTVSGKVTATSGNIGGFTISASGLYKGTNSLSSWTPGVYVGTNGIRVVGPLRSDGTRGVFTADNSGNISANRMALSGTLTIGGTDIGAAVLRSGAQSAYSNGNTWSTGAGYGYNYNRATDSSSGSYPSFFKANVLSCNGLVCSGNGITVNGLSASWHTKGFYDRGGNYVVIQYLGT